MRGEPVSGVTRRAWRVGRYGDINRTLDVTPIGLHDQDFEGLTNEEASARRKSFLRAGSRFERGELVSIDEIGGPLWAWRRMNAKGEKAPNFMELGFVPAVNAACKAVMEKANLGAINFHPIRILNAGRKSEPWPEEVFVVNVGNTKESLAIEEGLASKEIWESGTVGIQRSPDKIRYSGYPTKPVPLTPEALEGPDIWMESKLSRGNLFISDHLAKLLKAAKMTGGWGLKECPVLGVQ